MQALRTLLATALAAGAGFTIHVLYGRGWAATYAEAAERAGRLAHILNEPYPRWVVVIAATTALLPTFGKVVVYLLVRDRLPGNSIWLKGLIFSALLLLMSDAALRQPIMDTLVGVPGDVVALQAIEPWLVQPVMGMLIALAVGHRHRTRERSDGRREEVKSV